jgi:hypothetical protein
VSTPKAKIWRLDGEIVTAGTVREFVFRRDGGCMAARFEAEHKVDFLDRHVCGSTFLPAHGGGLTFEHVTLVHHPTIDGRKNDERHGVALCGTLNGETMTLAGKDMKEWFREYLRDLYPECEVIG